MLRVGLIGDYDPSSIKTSHTVTLKSLSLAAQDLDCDIDVQWLPTPSLAQESQQKLTGYQVLWAVPNTPYTSMEGALNGIRFDLVSLLNQ